MPAAPAGTRPRGAWFAAMLAIGVICSADAASTPKFDLETLRVLLERAPSTAETVRFGDMLFRRKDLLELKRRLESRKQPRAAIELDVTTWTGGVVPYVFDSNVSLAQQQQFLAACEEWSNAVKVRFVSRTNQENYVLVQDSDENTSYVGMVGGMQELHMLNWEVKFIICHELGHALGLDHEQCRSDRDKYITVHTENIEDGLAYNFQKYQTTNTTPYDFGSVMHYGMYAFSKNGKATITPNPGYESAASRMGQRTELSFYDKKAVAELYGGLSGLAVEAFVLSDTIKQGLPNNGNGRADAPGEHIQLVLTVRNATSLAASPVVVSLSGYSGSLSFSKTMATARNIPAGQAASLSFPFTVSRSAKLDVESPVNLLLVSPSGASNDTLILPGLPPGDPPALVPERVRVRKIKRGARRMQATVYFACKDSTAEAFRIEYSSHMKAHAWWSTWAGVRSVKRRNGVVNYFARISVKAADELQFRVRAVNAYGYKLSKVITVRR